MAHRTQQKNFLFQSQLSVLTHFSICFTSVLLQSHIKDPGHSAKSAGGRLPLNAHTPYICGFKQSDIVN